ncbi:hypothetical protein CFP56_010529 [Quercus suber]|uniref:Uncharacterized protein n=1 Tax=Quercus suber TaxID=58331 RepID=A0AAW0M489_QUESU
MHHPTVKAHFQESPALLLSFHKTLVENPPITVLKYLLLSLCLLRASFAKLVSRNTYWKSGTRGPTQTCSSGAACIAKIDNLYTAQKQKMNSEN